MNILINIPETIKEGIWILFILLFFAACTENEKEIPLPSEQATISFSLNTETIISRSGVENENTVQSLYILVLEENEGEYIFQEQVIPSIEGKDYIAELYSTESNTCLYFLVNIDKDHFSFNRNSDTEENIKERLILNYPGKDDPEDIEFIPMFGYININGGIASGGNINLGEVSIIRSLAAVTVENKAANFTLTSIQGYRGNSLIQIIPIELPDTDNPQIAQVSIPENSETKIVSKRIVADAGADKLEGLYLPESSPVTDINKQTSEATCLIIGGQYQGDETVTYYRVDFGSSETFGQLIRNYRYNIVITNVKGPGTTHPDEYAEKNIEYTIDDWTDSPHQVEL